MTTFVQRGTWATGGHNVTLGVMLPSSSMHGHARWTAWKSLRALNSGIGVKFVMGTPFRDDGRGAEHVLDEDVVRVEGRDGLRHVGKVTEKSAHFWLLPGEEEWRCKCDDDTLVHLPRLERTLGEVPRGVPAYYGYMKWRGWNVGQRTACGGVWGNAGNVWQSMGAECPRASGPFPYMAGGLYCMNHALRKILAADAEFREFLSVARTINDGMREACASAAKCAALPVDRRPWHHEDAGMAMNVFRAVARSGARLHYAVIPGHYNDPLSIERSPRELLWSRRAVYVHGIKNERLYKWATMKWKLRRRPFYPPIACRPFATDAWTKAAYNWTRARLPCSVDASEFCDVDVSKFSMCHWAWREVRPVQSHPTTLSRVQAA